MGQSVKFKLRKHLLNPEKGHPIYLQIIIDRKVSLRSTGISVFEHQWDDVKQKVKTNHPFYARINTELQVIKKKETPIIIDKIEERKVGKLIKKYSFTHIFNEFILMQKSRGAYWQVAKYENTIRKLIRFFGKDNILIEDVNPRSMSSFEGYMINLENRPNTIHKEMSRIRTVVNFAIQNEYMSINEDPFARIKLPKKEQVNRRKLTLKELHLIENMPLSEIVWYNYARDFYLFSVYANGIRFGDLCQLKRKDLLWLSPNKDAARLSYRQSKTGKLMNIVLPSKAVQIVKKYESDGLFLFPILDENKIDGFKLNKNIAVNNALINRYIKKVALLCGVDRPEELSFHTARHTFAFIASQKGNLEAVRLSLGHHSLDETQNYINSLNNDLVDQLNTTLWQ